MVIGSFQPNYYESSCSELSMSMSKSLLKVLLLNLLLLPRNEKKTQNDFQILFLPRNQKKIHNQKKFNYRPL